MTPEQISQAHTRISARFPRTLSALGEAMTPEQAADLQRAYVRKRKRWARSIGFPMAEDVERPEPGEIDAEDPELG